LEWILFCPEP